MWLLYEEVSGNIGRVTFKHGVFVNKVWSDNGRSGVCVCESGRRLDKRLIDGVEWRHFLRRSVKVGWPMEMSGEKTIQETMFYEMVYADRTFHGNIGTSIETSLSIINENFVEHLWLVRNFGHS